MLLQMGDVDVPQLLETPAALREKVLEAVAVHREGEEGGSNGEPVVVLQGGLPRRTPMNVPLSVVLGDPCHEPPAVRRVGLSSLQPAAKHSVVARGRPGPAPRS